MYESNQKVPTWQWVATIIAIIILIILGYFLFSSEPLPEESIQEYCLKVGKYRSINNIPVSCLKYFGDIEIKTN
jgi:Ni,Fe-hydrogenase I cytochrome b subunit